MRRQQSGSSFMKTMFSLMLFIVLQNVVTYSINMADNLMLGRYSQTALSGAATVNMIQFLFQTIAVALGDSVVIVGSQYWGQGRTGPVRKLGGTAVISSLCAGVLVTLAVTLFPRQLLSLFTPDEAIIEQGLAYLSLIRYTYVLYALYTAFMCILRTSGKVNIALRISIVSLLLDVAINRVLIFGLLGFPEMGIRGAAVGTLSARSSELILVLIYVIFFDKKLCFFAENPFRPDWTLVKDYFKTAASLCASGFFWALATPIQTGILGHLSSDAVAANSVSTTLFQYIKVVTQGEASAASVMTGRAVGEGDFEKIRRHAVTSQKVFLIIGFALGILLFFLRIPMLSFYKLTPEAKNMANGMLMILSVVFVGMAYQMPVGSGIIRGGGDTRFSLITNLISTWAIVIPFSFAAAFWWKLPEIWVVAVLNSDQIFKCLPIAIRCNNYKWIKTLTRSETDLSG